MFYVLCYVYVVLDWAIVPTIKGSYYHIWYM